MSVSIDEIIRSNRRTLGIEITQEARLIVRAPRVLPESEIQSFLLKKKRWIEHHQARLLARIQLKKEQQLPSVLDRNKWINRYKYLAFTIIKSRCAKIASMHGLRFNEFKISNAKRRWGSCSFQGNLNFNWRLILAPDFVIDYLIVHELSHLVVKDHSRRFWAKVANMDPLYLNAERWLKHNGYLLDI